MDERILSYIDEHREEMIGTLTGLIASPSPDLGGTKAQDLVEQYLLGMGFETEVFQGIGEGVRDLPDFCDPGVSYPADTWNLVGYKRSGSEQPSLLLFAHIDTEAADAWGKTGLDPFSPIREDGRIYGLGAADDKGGVAMMLESVRTALHFRPELGYDLTVLSILGKHGGAFGTLTAMNRGCTADRTLYIHPAETGHGFQEIKNISLGVLDLKLTVRGEPGILHDDLSPGVNANLRLNRFLTWLEEYNCDMRRKFRFDFGSFRGEPSYLLNVGSVHSDAGCGGIPQTAECLLRVRFFHPLTLTQAEEDLRRFLIGKARDAGLEDTWDLTACGMRAQPAMIPEDHPFIQLTKRCIDEICGPQEFIHQYHGGSDVRFPILYGNSVCVGIGPACVLPEKGSGQMEWISEEDYLNGIRILTGILLSCVG